ncbi:hypothetical protein MYSI104531_25710 [Mycobacterium simiae]
MRRRQRRSAGQRGVRLLGHCDRKRSRGLQGRLDQRDVDTGADDEHRARARFERLGLRDHRRQLGDSRVVVVGQGLAVYVGDRPVGGVDERERRGVGLDEQQRGLRVIGLVADRLGKSGRSQKGRDQHDVLDLVGGQRVTQRGRFGGVGPGDAGRRQLVATLGRAFLCPQDRGDYLISGGGRCGIVVRSDVEVVFVDSGAVSVFTFDQHHPDCRRRHRHTQYGVQCPSIVVCSTVT